MKLKLIIVLLINVSIVLSKRCPSKELIHPCICKDYYVSKVLSLKVYPINQSIYHLERT